jgi:hypothetical protein
MPVRSVDFSNVPKTRQKDAYKWKVAKRDAGALRHAVPHWKKPIFEQDERYESHGAPQQTRGDQPTNTE